MDTPQAEAEQRRLDAELLIARRRAFLQRVQAQVNHGDALLKRVKERLRAYREAKEAPE